MRFKKCKLLLFLFFVIAQASYAQSHTFEYKKLPAKYQSLSVSKYTNTLNSPLNGAVDLTTLLPAGFVTDGTVDYTRYLQAGIDKHQTVKLPDFPVLVNTKGLKLKSNTTLIFDKNSQLKMTPNDKGSYSVLLIQESDNVKVFNANILGDRKNHKGKSGQWGMGIKIISSTNVDIINPTISECWGDGIYLAATNGKINKNISIQNPVLDHNRRNGISVVSVDGLIVSNAVISNTFGQSPMAGIDIEPNSPEDRIDNVFIDNPITFNNYNYGIVVSLGKMLDRQEKNVNITINNHIDDLSNNSFVNIVGSKENVKMLPLKGNIVINNPSWLNSKKRSFWIGKTYNNGLNIRVKGAKVNDGKISGEVVQQLKGRYEQLTID